MKIIECPRDAMQGIDQFIPTEKKARYLNQLLKVGFDTVDFGSFVSPRAIPQMKDTHRVVEKLDISSSSRLLAIVANIRGAREAADYEQIRYLGFPISISETFQQRNTNKSVAQALNTLSEIQDICVEKNKELVAYISMGFGNPYGDPYEPSVVNQFVDILNTLGIKIISIADTIGVATPERIRTLFKEVIPVFPETEFGAHLHARPGSARTHIEAAYKAGVKRFDGAIKGYGGCPMAEDEMVGNIATETIVSFLEDRSVDHGLDKKAFRKSLEMAGMTFPVVGKA